MLTHLADVSIRSILLSIAALIVLWILRNRRTAALQHAIWATVAAGMLLLFAFGQTLPRLPLRILDSGVTVSLAIPAAAVEDPLLLGETLPAAKRSVETGAPIGWRGFVSGLYAAVALGFLAQFVTGLFMVRKLLASARPVSCDGANHVYESDRIAVPLTVGWVRPKILLPAADWREWEREKLNAVLAHEGAHARRHDGLVAALAGINRCIFWFHPLAWMLQRKLALLAEQACDESCVAELGDPRRYAHLLLEMANVVDVSQGRLRRHALTMAAGSHIHQRIDALLEDGRKFSRGLTHRGLAAVILCGVPVVLVAAAVQVDRKTLPPAPIAQSLPSPQKPAAPVQLAQAQAAQAPATAPQSYVPQFDSVTVKPCESGDGAGRAGRGGGGGGRGIPISPPGELFINCMSIRALIDIYMSNAHERLLNDFGGPFEARRIRGGPAWLDSDWYTIDAKTSDPLIRASDTINSPARRILKGPMLQSLLESRFQLKTHREVEQIPMFSLVVADSGFKLQPMQPGSCVPFEPGRTAQMPGPGRTPSCPAHSGWDGPDWTIDADGQSLGNLARILDGMITDRPVLDKTGIAGLFNLHLRFAHDQFAPGIFPMGFSSPFAPTDVSTSPSLPVVLEQQLGLKLVQDAGPHEYIAIDRVERP